MSEIRDLSRQIYFNNLTYHFKCKNAAPTTFFGFKYPWHHYKNIFNGVTSIEKSEQDKQQFRSDLSIITRRNRKNNQKNN